MTIGTIAWMSRGGSLTATEKWKLTIAGIRKRIRDSRPDQAANGSMLGQLDLRALDFIEPPTDRLSVVAAQAAKRLQHEWLTNHSWRTYAWGGLLALQAGLKSDRGILFAACQLHDIGLTAHAGLPKSDCFTLRGARAASNILARNGATADQIHRIAEAITLHMNLEVGVDQGVEAHLLQAGAGMDVIGQRSHEIPSGLQSAVLARHPRLNFKNAFCNCMKMQAAETPRSRANLYVRRLGFLGLIRRAPFDE